MSDLASTAPNTWRAVAGTKKIHIQNSPSQVKSCTTANCFMVAGISRIASPTSLIIAPTPCFSLFFAWNASMSSGGNSLVVITVQSTHTRNTSAPA